MYDPLVADGGDAEFEVVEIEIVQGSSQDDLYSDGSTHTHIEVEVRHRYVDTSHVIRVMWFLCTVKKSVINF